MSASREKRERQQQKEQLDPKAKKRGKSKKTSGGGAPRWLGPLLKWVVILVVVLGALYLVASGMGLPQRVFSAVTIGDEGISAAEFNYYYYMVRSDFLQQYGQSYGMTDTPDLDKQFGSSFKEQTQSELQSNIALVAEAEKNGLTLSQENRDTIDSYVNGLKTEASNRGISTTRLLEETYGIGMTEGLYRKILERILLAVQWNDQKLASLTFTEAEMQTTYDERKDEFDSVSYRMVVFQPDAIPEDTAEDAKEAAQTAAMEQARQKADAFNAKLTSETALIELADEYPVFVNSSGTNIVQDVDNTLLEWRQLSTISPTVVDTWLKDSVRKPGDHAVIADEENSMYCVVMFLQRMKNEYNAVNVRHVLIMPSTNDLEKTTEQLDADAKKKAEDLLSQWKSGEATETSFGDMATKNTEDQSSAASGGLYEHVAKGKMVKPFQDWIFDAARKAGDTGIVKTDYGYHIMYFVSRDSEPYWQYQLGETMKSEAYGTYLEELRKDFPIKVHEFGLGLTGTRRTPK